jgi:CarboxypepD_reg-like domain/TonB dependent receptor/TonB-dependent Receptor Plug Domain
MSRLHLLFTFLLLSKMAFGQSGTIKGKVFNKLNNEGVPFANVVIQGTSQGSAADGEGYFEITGLNPGQYNVEATFVGFKSLVIFEVQVTNARPVLLEFALEEEAQQLKEIEVTASNTFVKNDESPLSLRSIGPAEIKRTPGGNRDVSKVIRSLPGVASPPGFRNDIIIRGGAPSENTFYLDGIQIPVINHFQTQGSSGGPVGMLNVDLLKEVNFYSGAFPANRGNTLSSVFDFQLRDGRTDKWTFNGIVGATDLGVTFDGPVSEKSSLVISARRSYLKFLFSAFNLPFLPIYNDLQFKYKYKFNSKNQLTILGIGAIDDFELNMDAPEKAESVADREEAEYILNIIPVSTQWNYTTGVKYDHFRSRGNTSVILSTNTLKNSSVKYQGNDTSDPNKLIQDYESRETETRLRLETYESINSKYSLVGGLNFERAVYDTRDYSRLVNIDGVVVRDFTSLFTMNKWGLFGQASAKYFEKLTLSLGLRADANNYSDEMNNLLDQLSPRLSASYSFSDRVNANFNTGIYYQLPAYTVLGYRNSTTGELENKNNGVKYIRSKHLVSGLEFNLEHNARITAEGFYKWYEQYPFLTEEMISLANLGADFGTVGNAPVKSISNGRSYGLELLYQQKLWKGFYGILAYTFVKSEFETKDLEFAPSAWDNRHLVSVTGGKRFGKNWELGIRWLFTAGAPYTPYDVQETVRKTNWDVRPYGIPDYNLLNTRRISSFHQLDVRLDKKYYFTRWSLNVYLDVQNVYNYVTKFQDNIDVQKDSNGTPIVNPDNDAFYIPKYIQSTSGTVLPTIGIIVEL